MKRARESDSEPENLFEDLEQYFSNQNKKIKKNPLEIQKIARKLPTHAIPSYVLMMIFSKIYFELKSAILKIMAKDEKL